MYYTETYLEALQDITLNAFPQLYCHDSRYEDSRVVYDLLQEWAREFEDWWAGLSQEEQDSIDYIESVDNFTEKKVKEALKATYSVTFEVLVKKTFCVDASNEDEAATKAKVELANCMPDDCDYQISKKMTKCMTD